MLPEELSPANGVPTPAVPGFLGKPFSSDRVESLMFCLQELPGAWGLGKRHLRRARRGTTTYSHLTRNNIPYTRIRLSYPCNKDTRRAHPLIPHEPFQLADSHLNQLSVTLADWEAFEQDRLVPPESNALVAFRTTPAISPAGDLPINGSGRNAQ